jgi:hypothetical protein
MPPKRVFIVPYKNRIQHKYFFSEYMTNVILKSQTDYEIYLSHQCDNRPFNRGGVKNIGFMALKKKYPNDYKDITFIFNDIDTIPFSNIFSYDTTPNIVKHYYGFTYALGGIVVIKGGDFEKINGYPSYWGWGYEDNILNNRCLIAGITIDRSEFCPIGSPKILQLFDGIARLINKTDMVRSFKDNGIDGICTISNLEYTINDTSRNPEDNIFKIEDSDKIFYVNILNFKPLIPLEMDKYSKYDLRLPSSSIFKPNSIDIVIPNNNNNTVDNNIDSINDWTVIPPNPTQTNKLYTQSLASLQNRSNINKQMFEFGENMATQQPPQRQIRPPNYKPDIPNRLFKKTMFFM